MGIDDGTANCQAHTHSALFRGVEGFEGFVEIAQSGPVIANLNQDGIGVLAPRPNHKLLRTIRHIVHCLDPVLN